MQSIVIVDRHGLRVTSYGNGWAYEVRQSLGCGDYRTAFFQDDDASELRDRVSEIEAANPDMHVNDVWYRAAEDHFDL